MMRLQVLRPLQQASPSCGKCCASVPQRRLAGPRRLAAPRLSFHTLSEERLQWLIKAEVQWFAERKPESITLRQVIDVSTARRCSDLVQKELPIRFAQRIEQIEELPGWETSPHIVDVHQRYKDSFQALRLIEVGEDHGPFTEIMAELKNRMRPVLPHLAMGMRALQKSQGFPQRQIDQWLDTFLLSRIGTEMLTSQYMACVKDTSCLPGSGGIVQHCNPSDICERAALQAQKLCREHFKLKKDVVIKVNSVVTERGQLKFLYVPQYLYYILLELLKNSLRATVETVKEYGPLSERPIRITVSADPHQIVIRIRDRAGGIPFGVGKRVWSYMYSTAKDAEGSEEDFVKEGTPLAGYGVGMPLSRLYARYLGGDLHLMSMPGVGTSAYLYLKRIESEAREIIPIRGSSLSALSDLL